LVDRDVVYGFETHRMKAQHQATKIVRFFSNC